MSVEKMCMLCLKNFNPENLPVLGSSKVSIDYLKEMIAKCNFQNVSTTFGNLLCYFKTQYIFLTFLEV